MKTNIEISIDGNLVEIDRATVVSLNLSIANIEDPTANSVSFSKSIKIPMKPSNRIAMGFTEQLSNVELFNNASHRCQMRINGIQVMSGTVILDSVDLQAKYYSVTIISDEIDWVKSVQGKISELPGNESVKYALTEVKANAMLPFDNPSLIRFIPVDRGAFWVKDGDFFLPRTNLVLKDFHPFLNVWGIFEKMFRGYTLTCSVKSRLKQIYFPGAITESEDSELIEAINGFLSGRDDTGNIPTAVAVPITSHTPHSIISTTKSRYPESEIFDNGVIDYRYPSRSTLESLTYTPKNNVRVKFELTVEGQMYLPNCFIGGDGATPNTPGYFNVGNIGRIAVGIKDDLTEIDFDSSFLEEGSAGVIKGPLVYGGAGVFVFFNLNDPNSISYIRISWFSPNGLRRNAIVKVYPNQKIYAFRFHLDIYYETANVAIVNKDGSTVWLNSEAVSKSFGSCLYGTATKIGNDYYTSISMKVESKVYNLQANTTYDMFTQCISDNTPSHIIAEDTCQLTPKFITDIIENDNVTLETIGRETQQIELIRAIKAMFNLVFYTNTQTHEMLITPASHLVGDDIIDWTNKIDYSRQITIKEVGNDIGSSLTLSYQEGNDVVKEHNFRNQLVLGENKILLNNKTKTEGTTIVNPLFKPSLTRKVDGVVYAPQLKPAREKGIIEDAEFNIDPIVVELVPNTDTSIPAENRFPIAAFSDYGAKLSMNSTELGQFFSKNVQLYNRGRSITAYVMLNSFEIENIRYYNDLKQDYRSKYKILVNKEPIICDLQSIEEYNPIAKLAKCTFIAGDYTVDYSIIDTPILAITPTEMFVRASSYEDEEEHLYIECNGDWSVTANQSWIYGVEYDGSGNDSIFFYVSDNHDPNERIGLVTVTSGNLRRTLTITQAGATSNYLEVVPTEVTVDAAAESVSLKVNSNVRWNIGGGCQLD